MSRRSYLVTALAAVLMVATPGLRAQDPGRPPDSSVVQEPDATIAADQDASPPAHVAFVEGTATLERDGRPESGLLNMPLMSGDRVRTADGRVEVLFGDGSALYLDARTTVDVQSDDLLRLIDGRIRLAIVGPSRAVSYRIDSPAGAVNISLPGDYRLSMLHGERETQLELAVVRGSADIFTSQGTTPVRAGQRAYASATLAPSFTYVFNSAAWDDFDRWAESRRDQQTGVSAQYLPPEVQSYAPVLDEEGDWRYNQPYGYVWYPRVETGWRPYYYGRWMSYPRYGWTWVGNDRFGWPTHHYGRWGVSSGAWFWIPGPRWAPAYVSWAYAPGYVSWCPLGFDNRAVFALNVSIGRPYYSSYYSPWNYWTVVAAPHFGYGYVNQRVVHVDRVFAAQNRPVFVSRTSAPAFRGVAVPRGAAPIHTAGTRGVTSSGGSGIRANPAAARDNYFLRDGNRADHAVPRGSSAPLPTPPTTRESAPARSNVGQGTTAPRAVPRSGGSLPMYQSRSSVGAPATSAPRAAPDGAIRRAAPDSTSGTNPRQRVVRDPRSSYSPPASGAVAQPRRWEAPSAAPPVREATPRARPQVQYAPREYTRPPMAVPRAESPQPRASESPRIEQRAAPPPQRSAPERSAPERSAPARSAPERAAPRESSKPAPSQGSSSHRGGHGG